MLLHLSGALAGAVLIEMVLFRTFTRTGIYIFQDDTPRWVYDAYRSVVWFGNTMFNFAVILVFVLFAAIAAYLWMNRDTLGKPLPILAVVMGLWNLVLYIVNPAPIATIAYLALSVGLVGTLLAAMWKVPSKMARMTMAILAGSFLCVYYFETIAPLRLSGLTFSDQGILIFQIGEALAGIGILAAFLTWGKTRDIRLIALPAIVGILMAASYFSSPERFPLISTWALGVTMSLPFLLYAIGTALLGVTILKLIASGRAVLAFGLVLLFFSHRMLPLTYFNMLIIGGFLLIGISFLKDGLKENEFDNIPVSPESR